MEQFFKRPRTLLALRKGPLGVYLDSFAKRLQDQGYAGISVRKKFDYLLVSVKGLS